jgi:hypothetical protein
MDTSHSISCPRCGRPVPPDAPEGLCPACAAKALRQLGDGPAPADPAAAAVPPPTDASSGSDFPRLRQLLLNVKPRFGPGDALGPYRIHRLLGRGAMGEVYDAEHRDIGRRVALKVLNEGFDSDEDRARFLDEGRNAARIRHPNSVCVLGAEVIDHTLGLRAARLRVVRPGAGSPGVLRALVRELVASLPFAACLALVALASHREVVTPSFRFMLAGVFVLGQVGLYAPARPANGLASVQDLLTGTRVITRAPALAGTEPSASSGPSQTDPERRSEERRRIGPYEVLQPLGPTDAGQLYVGLDAYLDRRVWIHERTNEAAGKFAVDPGGYRRARLPWFNGRTGPDAFDAYELQDGASLLDRTMPLPVADVCRAVRDLADQIAIELTTGGLVSPLGLDRLWVTDDHRVRLLDFRPPMRTAARPEFTLAEPVATRTAQRFLHAAALRALDPPAAAVSSARLLPFWASDAFDRLARGEFLTLPDVVTTFRRLADEPDRVAPSLRGAGIVVNAIFSYAGFVLFRNLFPHASPSIRVAAAVVLCMTLAVFWAALFRGGFWLTVFRIGVARRDGGPVSRTRAAVRALCGYGLAALPSAHVVPASGLLLIAVLAGTLWTVITPARGPQDWLLNTYLVPR